VQTSIVLISAKFNTSKLFRQILLVGAISIAWRKTNIQETISFFTSMIEVSSRIRMMVSPELSKDINFSANNKFRNVLL